MDACHLIDIGLVSIVFGLISGYYRRTAGSRFFLSLLLANAGLYGFFIFFVPSQMPYGDTQCSNFKWLSHLMPPLALAQVIALANAAGNARREVSSETGGPGAARLGFSSAGLLLVLALFLLSYSSSVNSRLSRYNSDAKANLHNYFLACKAYWADEGGDNTCSKEIASQPSYGFNQSARVEILAEGNESSFTAFATHSRSDYVFKLDNAGDIEKSADSPFPPANTRWELFLKKIGVSTVLAG